MKKSIGRPQINDDMVNPSVSLKKKQWEYCRRMGRGNASWYLRKLIDDDMKTDALSLLILVQRADGLIAECMSLVDEEELFGQRLMAWLLDAERATAKVRLTDKEGIES